MNCSNVFITGFRDELKRELPFLQVLVREDSVADVVHTETSNLIFSCSLYPDLLRSGLAVSQMYRDSVWLFSPSMILGFELQLLLRMERF